MMIRDGHASTPIRCCTPMLRSAHVVAAYQYHQTQQQKQKQKQQQQQQQQQQMEDPHSLQSTSHHLDSLLSKAMGA